MRHGTATRPRRPAFTLVEIVITIGVLVLVATIAMPSVVAIINAGSDNQAYNLLSAQLKGARALAIESQNYTALHVQMADPATGYEDVCFATIMVLNAAGDKFIPADGFGPRRMPGNIAFGDLHDVLTGPAENPYGNISNLDDFTTFTVVFNPAGQAVKQVKGGDVVLDTTHAIFTGGSGVKLWDAADAPDELAATALTLFDYREIKPRSPADRATYLNANGQILAVNVFTGQLLPRE